MDKSCKGYDTRHHLFMHKFDWYL